MAWARGGVSLGKAAWDVQFHQEVRFDQLVGWIRQSRVEDGSARFTVNGKQGRDRRGSRAESILHGSLIGLH